MSRVEAAKETRRQARAWMVKKDIRSVDIQRALQMKNHNLVSETMTGKRNNRRVLAYLIDKGCPAEFLDIPKRMRKEIIP